MTTGRVASIPGGLQALTGETTPFGSPMLEPPGMKYETEMEVGRLSGSPRLIQNVTALNGTASYKNGFSKSVVLSTGSLPLIDCDVDPVQLEDMFYTIDSVTPLGSTSFKFKATDSPLFPYAPGALSSVSQVSGIFSFIMYNVWEFEDHTLRILWKSPWSVYWHYHIEEAPVGTFSLRSMGTQLSPVEVQRNHMKNRLNSPARRQVTLIPFGNNMKTNTYFNNLWKIAALFILFEGILGCDSKKEKEEAPGAKPLAQSQPKSAATSVPSVKPSLPDKAQITTSANGIVIHKSSVGTVSKTWPKITAGRYYKQGGNVLILGDWNGEDTFTPLDPPQTIDVSKSVPFGLRYPTLILPTDKPTKTYIKDDDGQWFERTYDPQTGTLREVKIDSK